MDTEIQKLEGPNYKKIYEDILNKKFPDKIEKCRDILAQEKLSFLDILALNQTIFGANQDRHENQKHRSYNMDSILKILSYQKKNRLNNSQLALHFSLSRNTVAKWKKYFQTNI